MKLLTNVLDRLHEWRKPTVLKALEKPVVPDIGGKSLSDLADPGWEIITGTPQFKFAGSVWQPYGDVDAEHAYGAHALIFACMRRIANSLCEAPLELAAGEGDNEEVITEHPTLALVNHPNRYYSRNDLLRYWAIRLLATGRGYVWKWRKRNAEVGELWPIPSSWVRERPGGANNLVGHYELRQFGLGGPVIVKSEDMIRSLLVDPATMTLGVGPLQAAQHDYQLDMQRENYLVEMLTNAHVPGIKFKFDRKLTQKEKQELRDAAGDRIGPGKRGSPLIMDLGGDAEPMEPLKDMDWPGLSDITEARICAAFGVPPILVQARIGIESGAQYANYETARRSFYAETLAPMWSDLADWLTQWLLVEEGEARLRFRFNLSKISALQEAAADKSTRVRADWQAGLIRRNEARVAEGWKALDDAEGDVFYTPSSATISAEATHEPNPPTLPPFMGGGPKAIEAPKKDESNVEKA